jgi:hypothetical protein
LVLFLLTAVMLCNVFYPFLSIVNSNINGKFNFSITVR